MTEYIEVEEHKRLMQDAFSRGVILGELRRLCTVHAAEPETLEVLRTVRQLMGDAV